MNIKWTLLTALAFTLPLADAEAITINTDTVLSPGDTTYEGADLVVSNCTLTVNGTHSFGSLWLRDGAVLTHSPAPNGEASNRMLLTITGNATVPAGCRMDVTGCGFTSATGPGAGAGNGGDGGGGGSHGGSGGQGAGGASGGSACGWIPAPSLWGSGGGAGYHSTPGVGGGSIRLIVGGTLLVDGSLMANGTDSTRPALGSYAGGGSGGSLWLTASTLTGAGIISADGGAGTHGGGGGGGRIAIMAGTYSFAGSLTATGASGHQRGGAGTIFLQTNGATIGQVRISNGGQAGGITPLRAEFWPAGATFDLLCAGAATVHPQGLLTLASLRVNDGAILSHAAQDRTFNLTIIGDAVIEIDGQINVARLGYPAQAGPGAGWIAFNGNAGGGGHGGGGGGAQIPYGFQGGGGTYDSANQPTDFGSGGGDYRGGAGGGTIRLNVNGTLQLDGQINAAGASPSDNHYGGGAGGSVWLQLGTLAGSGGITVAGGWSGGPGGGGGGGRVAIYVRSIDGFATNHIIVAGGWGGTYGGPGLDGTLRLLPIDQAVTPITITRSSGQVLLSWPSFSGLHYQLLSATNLLAASWQEEGPPFPGTGGVLTTNMASGSAPAKSFRLWCAGASSAHLRTTSNRTNGP